MSTNTWLGGAKKIAQKSTYLVGSSTNGHVFTISLRDPRLFFANSGLEIVSYTAGGSETATTIATELLSLLTTGVVAGAGGGGTGTAVGWQHDLNQALTWSRDTATLTAEANSAGVPFYMIDSGSGTGTVTTTRANAGPNDWDCGSNWTLGTRPVDTDSVVIQGPFPILYQTRDTRAALTDITISGPSPFGASGFYFYVNSPIITVNTNAVVWLFPELTTVTSLRIIKTGSDADGIGLHLGAPNLAFTNIYAEGGATRITDLYSGTITDLNVEEGAYVEHFDADSNGIITNVVVASGGRFISRALGVTTAVLTNNGGEVETQGTLVVTTMTNNSGRIVSNSTATITTLNCNGGLVDFTQSKEARTVTTANMLGGQMLASTGIITFTNAPVCTRPYRWSEVAA